MADDKIQHLQSRLHSDDALRERFRRSPHDVFEEHGIPLSEEQSAKLTGLDLASKSDEEVKGMVRDTATLKMTML